MILIGWLLGKKEVEKEEAAPWIIQQDRKCYNFITQKTQIILKSYLYIKDEVYEIERLTIDRTILNFFHIESSLKQYFQSGWINKDKARGE